MHWKHIWTALTASAATIRIFNNQWKQPAVEQLELQSVKRISEARNDEEEEGKGAKALEIFDFGESVAYIFAIIFTTVFVCALTHHFISCQRIRKKSTATPRQASTQLKTNMLTSNVITTPATTAGATKSTTTVTVLVKRTLKGRKSFHNCIGKNLKSLSARLVGALHKLLTVFMQCTIAMLNPLQKLELPQAQKQQTLKQQNDAHHKSAATQQRNGAHLQRNAKAQLSLTVADGSSTPQLQTTTTCDAVTLDNAGASCVAAHVALHIPSSNTACNTISSSRSNHQAIANFTKDTSKDQKLLMMIAQGFDCQHVDDFVTLIHCVKCARKKQQQKKALQAIKNDESQTKALTFYWQEKRSSSGFCWCNC